ncbi:MAG: 50S ribosomal protein L22 [Candidatus Levybacteria bacterium]|nr:50S ribosomal protein L22 [Candidatus Levybacteria bacterium]MBI2189993.1 50S ribosomal protein L22 [Candidatus Levybacteria bacterium]MBI2622589.1 50S ribosomal protein L22 [Candidatus Levybacteria bacterium]MBI3070271.1 50S ribosomal protein L22 [Candidatus Levybacteria bacterium]MBI3092984.1 50S ribosomal protein L22 [Candidatus Levybacteria bacterium]
MEIIAQSKGVRISPRKMRLIAKTLGGLMVKDALIKLSLIQKRGVVPIVKTIKSAVANALHNVKLKEENLQISQINIFEGPALKRYHPSTRGRTHPYKKRSSHIKVILKEAYGTKS